MRLKACAKINWALNVTGTREDGYHELDMLVQRVGLYDVVTVTESPDMRFETDSKSIPMDSKNLAVKAAYALKAACGVTQNARIHLQKNIPSQAGLGGGSADAAAVLLALNSLWQINLSVSQLSDIGVKLGADVPLCLYPGLTRVKGIGERVTPIDCASELPILLLKPQAGLSTADIFRQYDREPDEKRANIEEAIEGMRAGNLMSLSNNCRNQLQKPAAMMLPNILTAVNSLYEHKAVFAQMTGSGSCVFGVFQDEREALLAREKLKDAFPFCELSKTLRG